MKNKIKDKTERVKILWVGKYSKQLDYKRKKLLGNTLRKTSPVFSQSIGMFIKDFLIMTPERHKNMILIHREVGSKYLFVIEPNYIKLIRDSKWEIFKCKRGAGDEIFIEKYEDNALLVIKEIFKEVLKIVTINLRAYKYELEW